MNKLIEKIKEELKRAGIDADVKLTHVDKINMGYDAITVTPNGSNIGANLNIAPFLEEINGGASLEEVAQEAVRRIINGIQNMPAVKVEELTDYSKMEETLVVELISIKGNEEKLAEIPHKTYEDMALVYRFAVGTTPIGNGSILVTNKMLEVMRVTPEQIHADAMENAPRIRPAQITGMSEVIAEMMGREEAEMMGIVPIDPKDEQMFVATVSDKVMGAGVLAYNNFMEQASDRVGGSFFILPSSRHEVILIPDNGKINEESLRDMVLEVNSTQVAPEDKLTDSVYHYDVSKKTFKKVA